MRGRSSTTAHNTAIISKVDKKINTDFLIKYNGGFTMLKTNSKKAKENIQQYIIDHFTPEGYTDETIEGFGNVAAFILKTFRSEKYSTKEDYKYYNGCEPLAFRDWCQGLPSVLDTCYYYNRSAVEDLGSILEETTEEKSRYSEEAAENTLTALMYRELTRGLN